MQRILGGFETAAVLTGEAEVFNVVFVLRLAGGVAPERLERALGELQRRHPLLGFCVSRRGPRYHFAGDAPPPPLRLVERHGPVAWRAVAEEELDRRIDLASESPLRCAYLPPGAGDDGSEIVLTAHHAVIDGTSSLPVLRELLMLCAPAAALPPPDLALPPAAEDLFPAPYRGLRSVPGRLAFILRQLVDEAAYRVRRREAPKRPVPGAARCRIQPLVLDRETTAALVRTSRRERVTLNGALTTALLLVAQRRLYAGRAGMHRYFAFADLRPYLVPSPPAERVAVYVSGLRFTVPLLEGAAFWPVARRVNLQIAAAGRRGDKFHAARLMPRSMRSALARSRSRMATVALSYAGVVRFPGGYGLEVEGLHAFVSNLSCGPEITASVKLIDDRLAWDIVTLEADMDQALAQTVGEEILQTLAAAARDEGGRT